MRLVPGSLSLLLSVCACFFWSSSCAPHQHEKLHYPKRHLAGRDVSVSATVSTNTQTTAETTFFLGSATPCSGISCIKDTNLPTTLPCDAVNGIPYSENSGLQNYSLICNIDFPGQDIYPFVLAGSFQECASQCDSFNDKNLAIRCAGFVFAPDRVNDANDCYLKSSLNGAFPATIPLIGATLVTSSTTQISSAETTFFSVPPVTASVVVANSALRISTAAAEISLPIPDSQILLIPKVLDVKLLGTSCNTPTTQYIEHTMAQPIQLASDMLVPGVNCDLITDYPIASDTGPWSSRNVPQGAHLANLSVIPHLSRDGGKGGEINGSHVFIFCDTAYFTTTNSSQNGTWTGFDSSSVAVDYSMNGIFGQPLNLVDGIGEWQDDVGRMRGFAPMTTGEEAFNIALSGNGYRYAVWPESSLVPLNKTHSLIYASLVYDEVDMVTQAFNFTTLGNTLLMVSVDPYFGPGAQRIVNRLFHQDEISWGTLGGLRSWGPSGVGGMDGSVYLFGQVDDGVLVARTTPGEVSDRSSYTYWNGSSWSASMLSSDATSYLLDTPVMDLDVIYSPHHKTFILVYLTPDADNTFYYRYLKSDQAILPPYAGGSLDYAETLVENSWSEETVLYKANTPPTGFIYAGGVHAGYFGNDDILNGGTKMLLSWTQHTGQDAASPESGYAHVTAVITLN